ncbi:MAG: hypothetical protein ABIR91_00225 [Candidatus Saccharimonadales bacterium]
MTTLLIIHIVTAIAAVLASIVSLIMAWRGAPMTAQSLKAMWGSFTAVAVTGVALVVVSPHALTHTCVLMSAYVVMMSAVHVYARAKDPVRV